MRYAFVAAGWLLPWMAGPLTPTRAGKTVAVTQVVGLSRRARPDRPAADQRARRRQRRWRALTWSFAVGRRLRLCATGDRLI